MLHSRPACSPADRTGTALVLVLIVIVMLSLGAYTFSELMITEYRASDAHGRMVQAQARAESGVQYVAALLGPFGGGWESNLYHNPALFHVPLGTGGGFSIVAPLDDARVDLGQTQATSAGLRFGLVDECAKLNINLLARYNPDEGVALQMLMALPGMSLEIADAILDWIDGDDDRREFGAEGIDYSVVFPRNGPIDSLEELLLIPGITPGMLYGEDANRNGLLDPNENDGELSPPYDNADGVLDLGWSEYLTVHSRESNLRRSANRYGEPRINVNEGVLTELYDQLEEEFGEEVATFITAYRLYGPVEDDSDITSSSSENPLAGIGGIGNVPSTGDQNLDEVIQNLTQQIARNVLSGNVGDVTRGGMDLSAGATRQISSLYELIDAQVEAMIDGSPTTLDSPWTSAPGDLQQTLPILLDALSVTSNSVIEGRININQARREVLLAIPDMPEDLPDAIISTRARQSLGVDMTNDPFATAGWLLIEGLVDLPTMRLLDGFITARGEVYRMQVIGHADRGGPVVRIEAVIDASQEIPRVLFQRNLSELGSGYRHEQLPRFAEQ